MTTPRRFVVFATRFAVPVLLGVAVGVAVALASVRLG